MIPEKQIKRAIRFASPVVRSRLDEKTASGVLDRMRVAYGALAPEVPEFQSGFNQMTLKIAVDALAFYRALREVATEQEALSLLEPFVNNWMDGQFDNWPARFIYANRTLHLLFRRRWFAAVNRADEADGQKFEFIPPSGDLYYGVNVLRCGLVKFLTRLGAPEIAPALCRGDFHIGKYLPKGTVFKRSQVIADGAPYCDFRYYRVDGDGDGAPAR